MLTHTKSSSFAIGLKMRQGITRTMLHLLSYLWLPSR